MLPSGAMTRLNAAGGVMPYLRSVSASTHSAHICYEENVHENIKGALR
jgi:hypothetical protein